MKNKHWYDYLWIWSVVYFGLGFFNILFAWLGMIDFIVPLLFAVFGGNKGFCNRYCGRGQNVPETDLHRHGLHQNGFDMGFWYFS